MILLDCAVLAFSQQNQEPVYVGLDGVVVCEFAENGTKNAGMEILDPFIQNGKLYFITTAFPIEGGNLKPGFEFILSDERQIKAVYSGQQTVFVSPRFSPYFPENLWVAGFSENGTITITNVFLNEASLKRWLVTVKLAE
ncbi:MAG: hypothetical protein LBS79_11955 [Tannerella sp.]|nr:hypothetical protein [Tannerella sp.]